jgi:hypothetical protein
MGAQLRPLARACIRVWSSAGVQAPEDARRETGADWGTVWYCGCCERELLVAYDGIEAIVCSCMPD